MSERPDYDEPVPDDEEIPEDDGEEEEPGQEPLENSLDENPFDHEHDDDEDDFSQPAKDI